MKFKVGDIVKGNFGPDLWQVVHVEHPDGYGGSAAKCLTRINYGEYPKSKTFSFWRLQSSSDNTYTLVSDTGLTTLEKIIYEVKE